MALIDSLRNNVVTQLKPIEKPAEQPAQASQLDKALGQVASARQAEAAALKADPARQAEAAALKADPARQAEAAALQMDPARQAEAAALQMDPARQAEAAALKTLQADVFDAPVTEKTNLTGTTARELAVSQAETAALGQLSETQRDQYLNTRDALTNDPAAQSSLRSLLLNGKLTESEASDGTGNLLDQLGRLSSPDATTIGGVDKSKLLGQIVKDVSRPFTIDQGEGNFFCGATAALTGLAYRNPAEYARVAVDLGTEGRSALAAYYESDAADGSYQKDDQIVIEVKEENLSDTRRSITQQLMAPALTEMGNGDADVTTDGTSVDAVGNEVEGTYAEQVALMQEALTGDEVESAQLYHTEESEPDTTDDPWLQQKVNFLKEQIAAGAQVALKREEHWFTVTDIQGDTATVLDNDGGSKTMKLKDLFRHADAITYDPHVSRPKNTYAHHHGRHDRHEKPGKGLRSGGGTIDPGD